MRSGKVVFGGQAVGKERTAGRSEDVRDYSRGGVAGSTKQAETEPEGQVHVER